MPLSTPSAHRLDAIAHIRRSVLVDGRAVTEAWAQPWLARSWERCLAMGLRTHQAVSFEQISAAQLRRTLDANRALVSAATAVLEQLGRAISNTRYFALLTNADGVVVHANGVIDHSDPRADLISRVGTDLSERSIGTTAICTALTERSSVWLHRGEHFFDATSIYSCAGAPLFGPDGNCVGMLDVTGIEAVERPELRHLVVQSALQIENALLLGQPHSLLLRLNWPGNTLGSPADGLVCLDADACITGSNSVARQLVPGLVQPVAGTLAAEHVFGVSAGLLFDAARRGSPFELPLWSGLRLLAQTFVARAQTLAAYPDTVASPRGLPLRDLETTLIRKAVNDARGNVKQAAQALGISRATVYRKLRDKGH